MTARLLIANRGEIAVRIIRTAAEMGLATVGVAPQDDRLAMHMRECDQAHVLSGQGPAAYLDAEQIVAVATQHGCDAVHPGYGFLSESPAFAQACANAGVNFVGPTPDQLALLGDKAEARALAERQGVPILAGTSGPVTLDEARAFMRETGGAVMLKAVSGGGGRGIRLVSTEEELEAAYARCGSEAERAFGDGRVYVEQALTEARHIEVQILGDGSGVVAALGERDCTVQRRHQKLIEIAPSPHLPENLRAALIDAATRMASAINYLNAGTFEFLVGGDSFYFLEANPRLQVEHTVTEELWSVDLVRLQLAIAGGARLADLALPSTPRAGFALQTRINMERLLPDGTPVMDGGTITRFEPPTGRGLRVDSYARAGYAANTGYDSLLAKLIVSTEGEFPVALAKAERALAGFVIEGVTTNLALLRAILMQPEMVRNEVSTRFIDSHLNALLTEAPALAGPEAACGPAAVPSAATFDVPEGAMAATSPLTGMLVGLLVKAGQQVRAGEPVAVVEAMKMEHVVVAPAAGIVREMLATPGTAVAAEQPLIALDEGEGGASGDTADREIDPDLVRPDLAELLDRQEQVLDARRPEAVARRHEKGARTVRENIDSLCDVGSFVEYGSLVVAAQRARRSIDDLIKRTPGDGVVVGFGDINGGTFAKASTQSLIIAFDDTVLAGTMGEMAREKLKHCLEVARKARRPVVLFAEGGGGRAGDTDLRVAITGWTMDVSSYYQLSQMSGLTPLVGVTSGRCFAANAGMLACCDVIIATEGANIGVGGPTMIEGGRLGSYAPEEIGPASVQWANGVIDLLVADEAEAVSAAKRYLSYFQGPVRDWSAPDPRALRTVVPDNRLRVYDVRKAIAGVADEDSVLELRAGFGVGIVTSLIRVAGKPLGVIANNPMHLGGAIDSDGADKACRFMKLCEAFGLPVLMLCDTPGMMVGPEAERTATVRKMGRMFVTGSNLKVPVFTVVLRKGYGIGALLMAAGWFRAPRFLVAWPTGEFGGMNIEGNVKLAHAAELAAIEDSVARQARFEELVAEMHRVGRALSVATHFEVDNVIDPAETRAWIEMGMAAHQQRLPGSDRTVPFVDPW